METAYQRNQVKVRRLDQNGVFLKSLKCQVFLLIFFFCLYRQEVAASPPGYMQSLMSKIVNNISIVW